MYPPIQSSSAVAHRILAIGAHADDVELGALGFLLQHPESSITVCVLADGTRGGIASIREHEAASVARAYGAKLVWGGLPDTRIDVRAAIDLIETEIAKLSPDLVLVHDSADTHQDHRVAARATLSAARQVPNLYFYEGPSSRNFHAVAYANIDPVMVQKLELIRRFSSQLQRRRFDEWARVTAMYHGFRARPSCEFAEAFRPVRHALLSRIDADEVPGDRKRLRQSHGATRPPTTNERRHDHESSQSLHSSTTQER